MAVNLPKKLISVFESDQSPSLRPSQTWKEIILEPGLTPFFFDFHWRVRNNESIRHHSLTCLIQLASLNGQTLSAKNIRQEYVTNYIRGLIQLIDNIGK